MDKLLSLHWFLGKAYFLGDNSSVLYRKILYNFLLIFHFIILEHFLLLKSEIIYDNENETIKMHHHYKADYLAIKLHQWRHVDQVCFKSSFQSFYLFDCHYVEELQNIHCKICYHSCNHVLCSQPPKFRFFNLLQFLSVNHIPLFDIILPFAFCLHHNFLWLASHKQNFHRILFQ